MKKELKTKRMLAILVAFLCMMPATTWANKTVTTVTAREQLTKSSTVYVGEVVVDGTSAIKYLYSGDMTVSNVVVSHLCEFLNGMADKDYAALLSGHEFDYTTTGEGFALCTDAEKVSLMDGNWSSARYVGELYFPGKTVTSEINSNLYDIDEGFKAVIDAENAQSLEVISNPIEYGKFIVSHIGSTSADVVTYSFEEGEVVKHVNTIIDYSCEATTVIYTKVELGPSMTETPLTFEAVEDGSITVNWGEWSTPSLDAIQYKLNDEEWTDVAWNTPISLAANDVISFRGDNGTCYNEEEWAGFHFECSNDCYVYGNVMSLIDKDGFATNTTLTAPYAFFQLFMRADFESNTTIKNHPTKDIVLPATTLTINCYDQMFSSCEGITRAPALPATTLEEWCYSAMFMGCSALTSAPALPAITLAESCYADMFINCTNLTTAPDLPAPTLAEGCYSSMFSSCTSLNYVKCLATDISADYCTVNWLGNVAETGTFVKAESMEGWSVGPDVNDNDNVNGIPEGWTVMNNLSLADDADNSEGISTAAGSGLPYEVTLTGRTLYKDGMWNTLCLPFDVTLSGSPLDGATAHTVTAASITEETEGTTLNLTFGDAVTTLAAGTPYIIKWESGDDLTEADLVFRNVTINAADNGYDNSTEGDGRVRFLGTYKALTFADTDPSILFMGEENTLYYPQPSDEQTPFINAQRAYFKMGEDNSTSAAQIRHFNLNFGDEEATGIANMKSTDRANEASGWYTLDGRQLNGKPMTKGLYIHAGKKIMIK
ncbi:MAG: hypothetical protein IJP75_02605 [Bacteroidaceae bacterium]|nr:hypothetical protein [Bacteroidaceae bacterium]